MGGELSWIWVRLAFTPHSSELPRAAGPALGEPWLSDAGRINGTIVRQRRGMLGVLMCFYLHVGFSPKAGSASFFFALRFR